MHVPGRSPPHPSRLPAREIGRQGANVGIEFRGSVKAPGAGLEPATFRLTAGRAASCATPDGDLQDALTEFGCATTAQTMRAHIQESASR